MEIDIWSIFIIAIKTINYITIFLSCGSVLFLQGMQAMRQNASSLISKKLIINSAIIAIVSCLALVPLNAAMLSGNGFLGLFDIELILLVSDGPLGHSNEWKIAGLCMIIAATIIDGKWSKIVKTVGIVFVVWSFGQVGHTHGAGFTAQILVALHVMAVAFWMGSFWPLYNSASDTKQLKTSAVLAHGFGKAAIGVVPLLLMAGAALVMMLVGTPAKVLASTYGQVLILKIATVCGILIFAAHNKFRLVPGMLAGHEEAAKRLKKSISFEATFAILVLIVTAVLTTTIPLHHH